VRVVRLGVGGWALGCLQPSAKPPFKRFPRRPRLAHPLQSPWQLTAS